MENSKQEVVIKTDKARHALVHNTPCNQKCKKIIVISGFIQIFQINLLYRASCKFDRELFT
jgi:hypothetical protein